MRKFSTALILICLLTVFSFAEDRRLDKTELTIMTFNTEFLWDGIAPEEGNSQVKFDWKGDEIKAAAHMLKIAEVIRKNNADIINLVEVENLAALTLFNNEFLMGMGYKPYLVDGKDTFTGQDVALLTRIDPEDNKTFFDGREGTSANVSKSVSKNYVARIRVGNYKLAFIGLHFLAIPTDERRRLDRQAQADAIKQIALEQLAAGYSLIVWGDFNDYDVEDISRDVNDHQPITSVLANIRLLDRNTELDDLVNVAKFIEKSKRYTAWYDANRNGKIDYPGDYSSIDHILLSPELAGRIVNTYIQQDYNPMEVSDHFPIVVKLKLSSILFPLTDDGKTMFPTVGIPAPKSSPTPSSTPANTPAPLPQPKTKPPADREYFKGTRGGCYYLTASGSKKYVDRELCERGAGSENEKPPTLINRSDSTLTETPSNSTPSSGNRYIRGSRGGCYYINSKGKKSYVDRSKCN